MRKVAINVKHGGFGLSDAAYKKLIEWGVPVRPYVWQQRNPETGKYDQPEANDGEIIFDRDITPPKPGEEGLDAAMRRLSGRYWETWIRSDNRDHPLVVRVIEELGPQSWGRFSELKVVEIPEDVEYTIEEYDGLEWIAEAHRTWA